MNKRRDMVIPDFCTEDYWPEWSSRGMRSVRCTYTASATLTSPDGTTRRVCGTHARKYDNSPSWHAERDA